MDKMEMTKIMETVNTINAIDTIDTADTVNVMKMIDPMKIENTVGMTTMDTTNMMNMTSKLINMIFSADTVDLWNTTVAMDTISSMNTIKMTKRASTLMNTISTANTIEMSMINATTTTTILNMMNNTVVSDGGWAMLIFRTNHALSAFAGLLLNCILIWLIQSKTKRSMRSYSRILLMTCVVDLVYGVSTFVCQTLGTADSVHFSIVLTGPLGRWLSTHFGISPQIIIVAWLFCFFSTPTCLAIQFLMRYLVLCRQYSAKWLHFFLAFCLASSWQFVACALYAYASADLMRRVTLDASTRFLHSLRALTGVDDLQMGLLINMSSFHWELLNNFDLLSSVVIYTVILVCMHRIRKFSRANLVEKNAKRIHAQLSTTLRIQAVLPLCAVLVMNAVNNSSLLFGANAPYACVLLDLPTPWLAVLNPLVTIVVVRAYRLALVCAIRNALRFVGGKPIIVNESTVSHIQKTRSFMQMDTRTRFNNTF